jgi:long-chain fatty acid transport protein
VSLTGEAYAENGTFLTGYGVKSAGMGGVAVALPQDAMVAVVNPAGMSKVGTRYDIGSQFLFVHEKATIPGSSVGLSDSQGAGLGFLIH